MTDDVPPQGAAGDDALSGAPQPWAMRTMLFMLTFVAMGAITDFSKLRAMGKVASLYGLELVVVTAPIAYAVAYLFHRGLTPPLTP